MSPEALRKSYMDKDVIAESGEKTRFSRGCSATRALYKEKAKSLLTLTKRSSAFVISFLVTSRPRLPSGASGRLSLGKSVGWKS